MERIKDLHPIWCILIIAAAASLVSWGTSELFGKRYQKFYPNEHTSSFAIHEFKRTIGKCSKEEDEYGVEYCKFYDSRQEAIDDFMDVARSLDEYYANGKFLHLYVMRKERVYQCYDRKKNLIAVRFIKHRAGIWHGYKGEWKPFYEIDLYVEK